jgi:SAM-dependent methyltransferase
MGWPIPPLSRSLGHCFSAAGAYHRSVNDLPSSKSPPIFSVRSALMKWSDDGNLRVGNTNFAMTVEPSSWNLLDSTADHFVLLKTRYHLDNLLRFAPERVDNVVDLGIFKGGSIALYQELFSPKKMLGIDLLPDRVEALDEFISNHGVNNSVRLCYGTNQDDRSLLARLVREHFGDDALDLVVDDCSHRYETTRASLNTLLPSVRPGGLYVIEDWGWAHYPGGNPDNWPRNRDAFEDERTPMSKLILELVLVVASRPDLIREISIVAGTVYLIRGDASFLEKGFDIGDFYSTPGRQILHEDASVNWWQRLSRRL